MSIPKIIHYCWFGGNEKPELVKKCIATWQKHLPEYTLNEISENNFDIFAYPYTKKAFLEKRWAFVSDFARLKVLHEKGGIYLDTDMFVLKSFNDFLENHLVMCREDDKFINAAFFACNKGNLFVKEVMEKYNNISMQKNFSFITIPRVLTQIYEQFDKENMLDKVGKVKIFDSKYFYPFNASDIDKFNGKNAPEESYAVHMWNYSWGHPLVIFLKKIGIYKYIKCFFDKIGIVRVIKKIFRII